MHGNVAGLRELLVEAAAEVEAEAARVLARREERAQREQVVVRRGLAVHAVGPEVGVEVRVELLERELGQRAVGIERGHAERGDQQRVELERAVVARRVRFARTHATSSAIRSSSRGEPPNASRA